MKKNLVNLLAVSGVGLLILASCKKNDAVVTAKTNNAGQFTASTTTPVIDLAKVKDTTAIITFNFTASNYDAPVVEQNNILQIDSVGDNWQKPASYTLPKNATTIGFSTATFDQLLLKAVAPGSTKQVAVRVQHQLSSATSVYSNVINMTVTPINLTQWIYVPGDYEAWANNANSAAAPHEDSLISVTGNGIYTGIIDFRGYPGSTGSLEFKIVPVKGDWSVAYGDAGGGTISTSGGNLKAPTAAPYIVTVDMNHLTITLAKADWYSLIGNAIPGSNWANDTELKFINDGSNKWVVNNLAMTQEAPPNDGFKVRQDDNWNNSWGTSSTDGQLTNSSGVNIGVPANGNYNFVFVQAATAFGTNTTNPLLVPYTFTKQ